MWGNAVRIARIHGFDIKVDASWFLIAGLLVWSLSTAYFPSVMPDADTTTIVTTAVIAMLGLFASLILHELAHAEVAGRFNLHTAGITMFLFGGVAELQSEPGSATSEFWIAIAGPVASLCLALAFWFSALIADLANSPEPARLILSYLAGLNLILALFNLVPAFPMDGGRVLRAWLWNRSGDLVAATRRACAVSAVFSYGLMALGLFAASTGTIAAGLWPILIGLFLLATSRAALAQLETKNALDGRAVADLMTRHPRTAHPDQTLSDLVNRVFLEHGISFAPVVENGRLLGYVDLAIVRKIDREHWTTAIVDDVIESVGPENTVSSSMTALDLISLITKTGRRKFLVADKNELVGVITLSDILAHLSVFREVA
ncbi:site-2 protease family protein [Puniceibacterium sediminis]|uniref:Zinc metalloprotease n=1 Tax=Puniceibacterium sediminis TaxID=1608407 RepID=A0A238ZQ88_9RHOB|nr:site-2 protease family protein [Puniceibacterium sediminis]SNR84884.1 Zn-dependent protease (includes SpoIVFB) [Puniceibacterium sediminis]